MFRRNEQARQFGVTAVENLFITEYLPTADGDKIKVYLYGLYHSQFEQENFGVGEMAAALNLDEPQVDAALRYWERRRLVERVSDQPPTYVFHSLAQRFLSGQDQMAVDEGYAAFNEAVNTQLGSRRKLRESDVSMAYEWVEELGLKPEVVLMLLNHFADTRGAHFSFKSAEKTAVMMKEENIKTTEDAEQFFSHSKRTHVGARAVLAQFNLRRLPTEPELALYRKWTEQWGYEDKDILAAVQETVAANNPTFAYLGGILERLKQKGGGKNVESRLKQEGEEAALVKEVLKELGRPQTGAHLLLPAYAMLREQYSHELLLLAARSVQARGGMFEDLEPRLLTWGKQGLTSDKAVIAHLRALKKYEPLMLLAFERAGQEGRPGENDLLRLKAWLEAGYSEELVLEAAAQARSARQKLAYMDKVLDSWRKEGITTAEAAKAQESKAPSAKGRKLAFQDYDQGQGVDEPGYSGPDLLKEAREAHGQ